MGMTRKFKTVDYEATLNLTVDVLPGMNAGASTSAVPSPIEGSGTAWVLLGAWALSPARPTPIHPRHECRGFSALLVRRRLQRLVRPLHCCAAVQREGTAQRFLGASAPVLGAVPWKVL